MSSAGGTTMVSASLPPLCARSRGNTVSTGSVEVGQSIVRPINTGVPARSINASAGERRHDGCGCCQSDENKLNPKPSPPIRVTALLLSREPNQGGLARQGSPARFAAAAARSVRPSHRVARVQSGQDAAGAATATLNRGPCLFAPKTRPFCSLPPMWESPAQTIFQSPFGCRQTFRFHVRFVPFL
jgi:hypothetical protein